MVGAATPNIEHLVKEEQTVFSQYKDVSTLVFAWMEFNKIPLTEAQANRIEALDPKHLEQDKFIRKQVLNLVPQAKNELLNILVDSFSIEDLATMFQQMKTTYLQGERSEREELMLNIICLFFTNAKVRLGKNS